jgi:hypothetical protein
MRCVPLFHVPYRKKISSVSMTEGSQVTLPYLFLQDVSSDINNEFPKLPKEKELQSSFFCPLIHQNIDEE